MGPRSARARPCATLGRSKETRLKTAIQDRAHITVSNEERRKTVGLMVSFWLRGSEPRRALNSGKELLPGFKPGV